MTSQSHGSDMRCSYSCNAGNQASAHILGGWFCLVQMIVKLFIALLRVDGWRSDGSAAKL